MMVVTSACTLLNGLVCKRVTYQRNDFRVFFKLREVFGEVFSIFVFKIMTEAYKNEHFVERKLPS